MERIHRALRCAAGACCGRMHDRTARGFTIVELLIIIALLGIMAAMVMPLFGSTSENARTEAMASNAGHVKRVIILHAGRGDTPMSPGGFPATIKAEWFRAGVLPDHAWTDDPMVLEIVSAGHAVIYPAQKVFDPDAPGVKNAWYNASNGTFVVRVPGRATGAATLALFNAVNKTDAATLEQTDR